MGYVIFLIFYQKGTGARGNYVQPRKLINPNPMMEKKIRKPKRHLLGLNFDVFFWSKTKITRFLNTWRFQKGGKKKDNTKSIHNFLEEEYFGFTKFKRLFIEDTKGVIIEVGQKGIDKRNQKKIKG